MPKVQPKRAGATVFAVTSRFPFFAPLKQRMAEKGLSLAQASSVREVVFLVERVKSAFVLVDTRTVPGQMRDFLSRYLLNQQVPFLFITDTKNQGSSADVPFAENIPVDPENPGKGWKKITDTVAEMIRTYRHSGITSTVRAIEGYEHYYRKLQKSGSGEVMYHIVPLERIAYFTTVDEDIQGRISNLKTNYVRFVTTDGKSFYRRISLAELEKQLPGNFVRISGQCIVNMTPGIIEGRFNGTAVQVQGKIFSVSPNYASYFQSRYASMVI